MYFIYQITNKNNGKVYFGQTNNFKQRWSQHKSDAKHNRGTLIIDRAMAKHGAENFTFEVFDCCATLEEANQLEIDVIAENDSTNKEIGYNIEAGGNNSPHSPETRQKISDGLQKFYAENESCRKGMPLSDEWKRNISIASMGKPGTNTGKTFDDEWRVKISKAQAGKARKDLRRFSDEQEEEICRLYVDDGKAAYALGKQLGCQRNTITDILRRHHILIRRSGKSNGCNIFTLEQEKEICNLYEGGKVSRAELARKFGCGKTTIRDILLRHNIKL